LVTGGGVRVLVGGAAVGGVVGNGDGVRVGVLVRVRVFVAVGGVTGGGVLLRVGVRLGVRVLVRVGVMLGVRVMLGVNVRLGVSDGVLVGATQTTFELVIGRSGTKSYRSKFIPPAPVRTSL